jgi:hypothetical protein
MGENKRQGAERSANYETSVRAYMCPSHLAECYRRLNAVVIGIVQTRFTNPCKVCLVLVLFNKLHSLLERSIGEIDVECSYNGIDLLLLLRTHGIYRAALWYDISTQASVGQSYLQPPWFLFPLTIGHNAVVLTSAAEMSFIKGVPTILGKTLFWRHSLTKSCLLLIVIRERSHQIQCNRLLVPKQSHALVRTLIDAIWLCTHECGSDDHGLSREGNSNTEVMTKEGVSPWRCC